MEYIIVFRNSYREPHINTDGHGFRQTYSTYEKAKEVADRIVREQNDGCVSPWYYDYQIYQEVNQ